MGIFNSKEKIIQMMTQKEISKIFSEIMDTRDTIKNTYDTSEKERLWNEVIEKANEILELEPNNEYAIGEKIRAYLKLYQFKDAEENANILLNINSKNVIALHYLSTIERDRGNLEQEKIYLQRIIETSDKPQQKAEIRLARVKRLLEERKQKQEETSAAQLAKSQTHEELQRQYAEENAEIESVFTIEAQNEYIDNLYKDFLNGDISKTQLKEISERLKQYPDEIKSAMFIADLYSKMTDKSEEALRMLSKYEDREDLTEEQRQGLKEEINKYKGIISYNLKEQQEDEARIKRNIEQKVIDKERYKEQRQYSKLIIDRMKKGKISEEELPEIVSRLESYPDKPKGIFLITKLYEIVEGRKKALEVLVKYSQIENLSYEERKLITNMQEVINARKRNDESSTEKIRKKYIRKNNKKAQQERAYKRTMKRTTIIEYIEAGKTLEQIKKLLENKGLIMTITTIRNIRDKYYKDNGIEEKLSEIRNNATKLLEQGYEPTQVYKLVGHEISLKEIKQLQSEKDKEI